MLNEIILVECQNASESIDSVFILGYTDNIKRLMFKLCDRYRDAIRRIKESKRRIQFSDFVKLDNTKVTKYKHCFYGVFSMSGIPCINTNKGIKRSVASANLINEREITGTLKLTCGYWGSSCPLMKECRRFQ